MFKSRAMNLVFLFMVAVIICAVAAYFVIQHNQSTKENISNPTVSQIVNQLTVSTGEITTNIQGDHYIKVNFNIQVSNEAAKDELSERSFQVRNGVIYIVSSMTTGDLQGQNGLSKLENDVKNKINSFLKSGYVVHVYTTEKIVQ